MKTAIEVKEEFRRRGITVAGWAREHGFSRVAVMRVLSGKARGYWGDAHRIAVMLGVKDGEITAK